MTGILIFSYTSCKKDSNKGILLTAYIWSHINERKKLLNITIWQRYHDFSGQGEMRAISNSKWARSSGPLWPLHSFLLALHTNLAADAAKLGVCVACTRGGETEGRTDCGQAVIAFDRP